MALVQVIIDTENPDRPAELSYPYLYVGRNNIYYTDEARIIGCDYKPNPHTMSTADLVALVEKLNFRQLGLLEARGEAQFSDLDRWQHYSTILDALLKQMTACLDQRIAYLRGEHSGCDEPQNWEWSDMVESPEQIVHSEYMRRFCAFVLGDEKLRRIQSKLKQQIKEMENPPSDWTNEPLSKLWRYRRKIKECFVAQILEFMESYDNHVI